jgi:septal ring factor EnvC (AmiA/AmiB activator)
MAARKNPAPAAGPLLPGSTIDDEVSPFSGAPTTPAPAAPVLTPVDAAKLVARLQQLQRDVQAADRERAAADAQLTQARKDLKEIDDHLTSMSVNPDTAAEALLTLEQELAALTEQIEQAVTSEREVYKTIAAAAS